MADIFNCYFVHSIRLLNSNDQVEDVIENRRYSDSGWEIFEKIGKEKLYKIVRKLENKASTEEGINVEVIKYIVEVAAEKIGYVFNASLKTGIFPNE